MNIYNVKASWYCQGDEETEFYIVTAETSFLAEQAIWALYFNKNMPYVTCTATTLGKANNEILF